MIVNKIEFTPWLINLLQQELKTVLSMGPTCRYTCPMKSRYAPNEITGGVLGDLLPDLDQGITEPLDGLRYNAATSDGQQNNVPEVFCLI